MDQRETMVTAAEFVAQGRVLYGERVGFIVDPADTQVGLIDLPDNVTLRKQSGTIVMIGLDVDTNKSKVRIGDRVLFTKYAPQELELSRDDGSPVTVCVCHVFDLYVGWRDDELRGVFLKECEARKFYFPE